MKILWFIIFFAVLVPASFTYGRHTTAFGGEPFVGKTSQTVDQPYHILDESKLAEGVNRARTENGLPALVVSEQLVASACAKAQHMIDNDYWDHVAPDGTTPWYFFGQVGYGYISAGENLAYGFSDEQSTVDGWMDSPTHRENILLPDYSEQGVCIKYGEYQGGKNAVIVNHFGTKL